MVFCRSLKSKINNDGLVYLKEFFEKTASKVFGDQKFFYNDSDNKVNAYTSVVAELFAAYIETDRPEFVVVKNYSKGEDSYWYWEITLSASR